MAEPVLQADRLVKSYGQGKTATAVLRGLDISLRAGEFAVILGPSGSGKSTLLNLLGLMDAPDSGEIRFSGISAGRMSEYEKARLRGEKLGFVFQFDSLLPEFTIIENVVMPSRIALSRSPHGQDRAALTAAARSRGLELLGGFGLSQLQDRFPHQVSGGEKQRAALCRALINRPTVVLADEPTGNLDKRNGELVFKDLKILADRHDTAVLLVTHNESACAYADRVLHMQDGAVTINTEGVRP